MPGTDNAICDTSPFTDQEKTRLLEEFVDPSPKNKAHLRRESQPIYLYDAAGQIMLYEARSAKTFLRREGNIYAKDQEAFFSGEKL